MSGKTVWISFGETARRRACTITTISRQVRRLAREGLIEVRPGPQGAKLININTFNNIMTSIEKKCAVCGGRFESRGRVCSIKCRKQNELARKKKWKETHKESISAQRKRYYTKNKDRMKQTANIWRKNNKDKIEQQAKRYYNKHRVRILEAAKAYNEKNKDSIIEKAKKYRIKRLFGKLKNNPEALEKERIRKSIYNRRYRLENQAKIREKYEARQREIRFSIAIKRCLDAVDEN